MHFMSELLKKGSPFYYYTILLHNTIYLLDAYHPALESHQHCHRHLPCPEVRKVIAVVLVVHLQEEPVAQQLGRAAAAVAVEVSAELPAGPVVHQQLEMVAAAAAALPVVDISPQEYPSIISLLLVYNTSWQYIFLKCCMCIRAVQ